MSSIEIGKKSSFYARHLHITGIELSADVGSKAFAQDVADDMNAMKEFELPDLLLTPSVAHSRSQSPEERFFPQIFQWIRNTGNDLLNGNSGILGAAAMALLFILPMTSFRQNNFFSDTVRVKGADRIVLHLERNGVVTQAVSGQRLENGDRVRVEVLAAAPKVAFQFVTNSEYQVLTPLKDVMQDHLTLAAGDRGIFPGSIELIGENDGEMLHVLVCSRPVDFGFVSDFISEYAGRREHSTPKGCLLKAIELR